MIYVYAEYCMLDLVQNGDVQSMECRPSYDLTNKGKILLQITEENIDACIKEL